MEWHINESKRRYEKHELQTTHINFVAIYTVDSELCIKLYFIHFLWDVVRVCLFWPSLFLIFGRAEIKTAPNTKGIAWKLFGVFSYRMYVCVLNVCINLHLFSVLLFEFDECGVCTLHKHIDVARK